MKTFIIEAAVLSDIERIKFFHENLLLDPIEMGLNPSTQFLIFFTKWKIHLSQKELAPTNPLKSGLTLSEL